MKKSSLFLLLFLLIVPSLVSAHTDLIVSNPAEGQSISGNLNEITLTFEEEIEKLSSMKLVKDNVEIPLSTVQIQEAKLIGKVGKSLPNGAYVIQWNIAGHDGHPVAGKIHFQINSEKIIKEQTPSASEDPSNKLENDGSTIKQAPIVEKAERKVVKKTPSNKGLWTIIGSLIIIMVIGFLVLARKK